MHEASDRTRNSAPANRQQKLSEPERLSSLERCFRCQRATITARCARIISQWNTPGQSRPALSPPPCTGRAQRLAEFAQVRPSSPLRPARSPRPRASATRPPAPCCVGRPAVEAGAPDWPNYLAAAGRPPAPYGAAEEWNQARQMAGAGGPDCAAEAARKWSRRSILGCGASGRRRVFRNWLLSFVARLRERRVPFLSPVHPPAAERSAPLVRPPAGGAAPTRLRVGYSWHIADFLKGTLRRRIPCGRASAAPCAPAPAPVKQLT